MNDMFAFLRESGEKPEPNMGMKIMARVDEPEATGVNIKQYLKAMRPKNVRNFTSPLNEMVGDCVGNKLSPEAIAAGVTDVALWAGFKNPTIKKVRAATIAANELPKVFYGDDYWKEAKNCKEYREQREALKGKIEKNMSSQENKLINLFKPPIPHIDY
jgi:hypothetical protein